MTKQRGSEKLEIARLRARTDARGLDEQVLPLLRPWWQEILGFILLVISILLLLALVGWTSSTFLSSVTSLTRQLIGWAAYPLYISMALSGAYLMGRGLVENIRIRPKILLAITLLILLALPITHVFTNTTFAQAYYSGKAGGLTGWALSDPLVGFFGAGLTMLLYVVMFLCALAILGRWTFKGAIRACIYAAGRLQVWSEQILERPQDEAVRVVEEFRPNPPTQSAATFISSTSPIRDRAFEQTQPIHAIESDESPPVLLPPLTLLERGEVQAPTSAANDRNIEIIEQTLQDFGLEGKVIEAKRGPSIIQYGIKPGYIRRFDAGGALIKNQKVRVSQIANLRSDMALALAVPRLRIEAPIPGRGLVGIEVPNPDSNMVRLRDVLESAEFTEINTPLAVALGQDVAGLPFAVDLAKMPHLLIAGTTGSGKSICMKALITALIASNTPETLNLIMIDPKRVEMLRFNGLPHLLGSAEVDGERVIGVLRWLVAEMERRYAAFSEMGARQLTSYNKKMRQRNEKVMPHLAVFIDELADLMAQYGAETERTLCRLAQMARATGIHLVVATQRPSTDVITGLIKANFPARISFAVSSSTDSRVILDSTGAEQLLGMGDMLFLGSDSSSPKRIQGCYVSDEEIDQIVDFWTERYPDEGEKRAPWQSLLARLKIIEDTDDELERAIELCQKYDNLSTSLIQRRLRVGFPRAARIMETLYEMGLVADPKKGGKTRKTYVSPEDENPLDKMIDEQIKRGERGDSAESNPFPE